MLKFYYHPLSPIARRVWIALLEKEVPFEPVIVDLKDKQQFSAEYLALNPFHHVPAIVHGEVRLIESFAILDYLDKQFPKISLSPVEPAAFGKMRMVQMTVMNELSPKLVLFLAATESSPLDRKTVEHLETCLRFLQQTLGNTAYFGGNHINLADVIAGATVSLYARLGLSLEPYPLLECWHSRIIKRPAWQITRPEEPDFQQWKRYVQLQVKLHRRKLVKSAS
ncbi:MAG: glutathione S-transferase family protein [Cyanobacteria bacterium P01_D01_bin.1]